MLIPDYTKVPLGKREKKVDKRTFQFAKYLNLSALPIRPVPFRNATDIPNNSWGMMGNDTVGDCTCGAGGHAIQTWTDANKKLFTPPDSSIITAYTAVTALECQCAGYDPNTGQNDNGCACLDVLNYWRSTGIDGHKITAFAEINVPILHEVQYAIYLFGLAYIGLDLPISAQQMTAQGIWKDGPNMQGIYDKGSWGGHCVIVVGYDTQGLDVITWGQRIRMTWGFWNSYVTEAYAALSPDFIENNVSPQGFNLAQLQADLAAIPTTK